jgi:hypothetical protein
MVQRLSLGLSVTLSLALVGETPQDRTATASLFGDSCIERFEYDSDKILREIVAPDDFFFLGVQRAWFAAPEGDVWGWLERDVENGSCFSAPDSIKFRHRWLLSLASLPQ